ncbi:Nucleotidyltransferase family protein, related [Eimeria praecox]|uniref:Nucleotidyltransferase family protein, related n=1 Tax=Eimeria praecox TaxID=51316 RepID=U6H399_9EIME|nr:Nucleotidyltransferase family protein, related [Eimeria praecox]
MYALSTFYKVLDYITGTPLQKPVARSKAKPLHERCSSKRSSSGGRDSMGDKKESGRDVMIFKRTSVTPAASAADAAAAAAAAAATAAGAMELPPVPPEFDALADDFISALGPNEERSRVRAEAFEHLRAAILEAFTDFRVLWRQQQELQEQQKQQHQLRQHPQQNREEEQQEPQIQKPSSSADQLQEEQHPQVTLREGHPDEQQDQQEQRQDGKQQGDAAAGSQEQEAPREQHSLGADTVLLPPEVLLRERDQAGEQQQQREPQPQQEQQEQQEHGRRLCRGSSGCCRARTDSPSSFFSVSSSPSPTAAAAVQTGAGAKAAATAPAWGQTPSSSMEAEKASAPPSSFQASADDHSSSSSNIRPGTSKASADDHSSSSSNIRPGTSKVAANSSECDASGGTSSSSSSSSSSNTRPCGPSSSVRCLSDICVAVLRYGSFPLLTYLPDGDLDVGVITFSPETGVVEGEEESEAFLVYLHLRFRRGDLKVESQAEGSDPPSGDPTASGGRRGSSRRGSKGPRIRNVHLVKADVKILKLEVDNLAVDLSVNKVGGCCSLALLELLDRRIGRFHLFKRSVILVKAWMAYESHLLGSRSGLLASYCLEVLVLHLFSCLPPSKLRSPLQVLQAFLSYFSSFDWAAFAATAAGPLPLWLLRLANQQQQQQALLLQQLQQQGCEPQQQQQQLQQMPFLNELLEISEQSSGSHRDGDPRLERLAFVSQHIHPERGFSRETVTIHVCKCIANFAFVEECRRRFRMCYGGMGGPSRFSGTSRSGQAFGWPEPSSPTAHHSSSSSCGSGRVSAPTTPMSRWSQPSGRGSGGPFAPPCHSRLPTRSGGAGGFTLRCINVVDPLLNTNNLGRSVSEPAFIRLVDALKRGHATLTAVLQRGDRGAFQSLVFKNSYSYLQRLRHEQAQEPPIKPLILLRLNRGPSQYPRSALEDDRVPCPTRDPYAEFLKCLHSKTGAPLELGDRQSPLGQHGHPQLSSQGPQGASSSAEPQERITEGADDGHRAEGRTQEGLIRSPGFDGSACSRPTANHLLGQQQQEHQQQQPHQHQQEDQPGNKINLQLADEELRGLLALCQLLCKTPGEGNNSGVFPGVTRRGGAHYACASLNAFGSRLCICSHPNATRAATAEELGAPPSSSSEVSVGVAEEAWVGGQTGHTPGVSEATVLPIEAAAAAEAAITIQILLPYCTRGCRRNSSAGSYANDVRTAGGPPSIGSPRSACSLGRTSWETRGGGHRMGGEGAPRGSRGSYNDRLRRAHPFSLMRHRAGGGRNSLQHQQQQHHLLLQHLQQHHPMHALPPSRDPYWQSTRQFSTQPTLIGAPLEGPSPAAAGVPLGPSGISQWRREESGSPSIAGATTGEGSPAGGIGRRRLHRGVARQGCPLNHGGAASYQQGRHITAFSPMVAARAQPPQQGRGYASNSGLGLPRPIESKEAAGVPRKPLGWSHYVPLGGPSELHRDHTAPRHAVAFNEKRRSSSNSSNSSSKSSGAGSRVPRERCDAAGAPKVGQQELSHQQDLQASGGSYVAALTGHQGPTSPPTPTGKQQEQQQRYHGGDRGEQGDIRASVVSDLSEDVGESGPSRGLRRGSGDWTFSAVANSNSNSSRSAHATGMRTSHRIPQQPSDVQTPQWGTECGVSGTPPTPSSWSRQHQQQGGAHPRGGICLPLRNTRGGAPNAVLQGLGLHVATPSAAPNRAARYRDAGLRQGGTPGGPTWSIPEPPQQPPPPPPPPPATPSGAVVGLEAQAEGPRGPPHRRNWAAVVGAPASAASASIGGVRARGTPASPPTASATATAASPAAGSGGPRPASAAARPSSPSLEREVLSQKASSEGHARIGGSTEEAVGASPTAAATSPAAVGASVEGCSQHSDGRLASRGSGEPRGSAELRKSTPQWGTRPTAGVPSQHPHSKAATPKWAIGAPSGGPRVGVWGSRTGAQDGDGAPRLSEQQQQQQQQWDGSSTPPSRGHSWAGDSTGLWRPGPPSSADVSSGGLPLDGRSHPSWGLSTSPPPERGLPVKQRETPSLTGDLLSLKLEDIALLSAADKAKALLVAKQQVAALQDAAEWRTATSKRERKKSSASGRHAKSQLAHLLAVQQLLLQQQQAHQDTEATAEGQQRTSQPDSVEEVKESQNSGDGGVADTGEGPSPGAAGGAAPREADTPP